MPFRFQAIQVFLTYSQVSNDYNAFDTFHDAIKSSGFFPLCSRGVLGREPHADGGTHYHLLCVFKEKLRTSSQSYFDVGGNHPNISAVANAAARLRVRKYCEKGGEFVSWGDWDEPLGWPEIWKAETEADFWAMVEKHKPEAIKSYNALKAFAKDKFAIKEKEYISPNIDFNVPVAMDSWYEDVLQVKTQ